MGQDYNKGLTIFLVGQESTAKENVSVPKLEVWSTFSKVVGVGNAHKRFPFMQGLTAKRLARLAAEHNGESLKKRKQQEKATLL